MKDAGARAREHPTEVDCGYSVVHLAGSRFVQLNTYGSAHRHIPGKVSQTLQLDEQAARQLIDILRAAFRGQSAA